MPTPPTSSAGRRRKDQSQRSDEGASRQLDFGGDDVQPVEEPAVDEEAPSPRPRRGRRQTVFWSAEEEEALRRGVAKHGPGKWKKILLDGQGVFLRHRTNVDLKDKWKNLQVPRHTRRKRRRAGDATPTPSEATATNGEGSNAPQVAPVRARKTRTGRAHGTSDVSSPDSMGMRPRRQAAVAAERATRGLVAVAEEGDTQRSVVELKFASDHSFPELVPVTINLESCRDVATLVAFLRSSVLSHVSSDADVEVISLKTRVVCEDKDALSQCIRDNGPEFYLVVDESPEVFV